MTEEHVDLKTYIEMLVRHEREVFEAKLAEMDKAVVIARNGIDYRLAELNNLRREYTLNRTEDRAQLVTRSEAGAFDQRFDIRCSALESRVDGLEQKSDIQRGRMGAYAAIVVTLTFVVPIILRFVH